MPRHHILSLWLFFCAFMVIAMTGIGAITRLTESGLSITEWKPVSGILPPLNDTEWQHSFAKYQATPEFAAKHSWMQLNDYKSIFFWEWFHRLWGRLIGMVFAIPFAIFWLKGWIKKENKWKYISLLLLGASQGGLGWFMVKSGLVDQPSVSHFRLAAHLSLALSIYCALLWVGFQELAKPITVRRHLSKKLLMHGIISFSLIALTIIWGAFVAGLDAGQIYNTFPHMGAGLVPPEFGDTPFLTDPASVQFTHRVLAMVAGLYTFVYGIFYMRHHKAIGFLVTLIIALQVILGIATLLSNVLIPLAVLHQINAVLLLSVLLISIYTVHSARSDKSFS